MICEVKCRFYAPIFHGVKALNENNTLLFGTEIIKTIAKMLVGKISLYRYFFENHSLTDMSKERDRALVKTHINNQNIVNYCKKK